MWHSRYSLVYWMCTKDNVNHNVLHCVIEMSCFGTLYLS